MSIKLNNNNIVVAKNKNIGLAGTIKPYKCDMNDELKEELNKLEKYTCRILHKYAWRKNRRRRKQ